MRLLFITNSFFPEGDATSVCLGKIIEQLTLDGTIQVDILSHTGKKLPWQQSWKGNGNYKAYSPALLSIGETKALLAQGKWGA